ncbi:MAG: discoidin domain-containing protein [Anaerolineae bacterium]
MRKSPLALLIISVAFIAAACASNDTGTGSSSVDSLPLTEGITFLPIDEIIDQELEVTNFANDGSATLPIHTSVSVACTIVYGKTPEFGSLTLDQDMNGGTHANHNPLLSNLEPETTYYFRVQGVDDNGNVYLSETVSFTTPPMDTNVTENLASPDMGAKVTGYSSAFGGADPGDRWGVLSAFDDNPNTEWSSAGDGSDAWVEVELAQRALVRSVAFQTRSMSDGSAIALAFTITADGGETLGPFELPDVNQPYVFDVAIEANTLRFDLVDTTGGNTGAVDIAVYGEFIGP